MVSKFIESLLLPGLYEAVAVFNAIYKTVTERLLMRRPAFFVIDNSNPNPVSVRRYMISDAE